MSEIDTFVEQFNTEEAGTFGNAGLSIPERRLLTGLRSEAGFPITFWSYAVKNAADRHISWILKHSSKPDEFMNDYYAPRSRQEAHTNPRVKYPQNVDDTKVYGVANVHRYFPAQLLRYLEAIRLYKVTGKQSELLSLRYVNRQLYRLDWREAWLQEAVWQAEDVIDVPVNIALNVIGILKNRDLNDEQLAALLIIGYDPIAPTLEHGVLPDTFNIWDRLLQRLEQTPENKILYGILRKAYSERLDLRNSNSIFIISP